MALAPGSRLGAFEVVALIGAGGMGEVYRARDTRLDRTVALKILTEAGSQAVDPRRIERFRQEARAIARITHPNICTLYDVAQEGATTFLVMEYVEGTTLARRLEDGPLPLAAALKIAIQIADALDHAHRQGVVHRDLKPSNIMLARDRVKLLDFGLAKLKEPDERVAVLAATETQLTDAHTIVGTAPYMAPEQIEGRDVDARTDIFAFGIVLYEMIAGRRPFTGDSNISVLAAIVGAEPPSLSGLQPGTPPILERLVTRCLAKDPDDRWQTARDLAAELRWIGEVGPSSHAARPAASITRRMAVAWAASIVLAILAGGLLATRLRVAPASAPPVMRFTVSPPDEGVIASVGVFGSPVAVSPDGRHLAFLATTRDGARHLYVRSLDGVAARRLSGTSGALQPFWSPDGQAIGFFAGDKLLRISIAGGEPQTICDAPGGSPGGATWNQDGVILFSPHIDGASVHRVAATGGTPTPVTRLDGVQDTGHLWPAFLPDGRHFFFERLAGDHIGIYVQSLDSGEAKPLVRTPTTSGVFTNMPLFAPPRYLLYGRRGAVLAQALDLERLEPIGEPFQVAERVETVGPAAAFSVSHTGVLAYLSGGSDITQLTWVDRTGRSVGTAGAPGSYAHLALSPDAAHVAVEATGSAAGVWVLDLGRGASARLTADVYAYSPVWSPDGAAILFAAVRDRPHPNLFVKRLAAPGDAERLIRMNAQHFPTGWSSDGQSAVFMATDPITKADLWRVAMSGDRTAVSLLQTPANESHGRISPDGRWLAYDSDESGRSEVYVTSYPQPGRKWPVSVDGGANAVWRSNGRELYYESADRKLMAVPVKTGPSFEPGVPAPLFELKAARVSGSGVGWSYDAAPDGRFLVNTLVGRSSPLLTVVVNWLTEIGKH